MVEGPVVRIRDPFWDYLRRPGRRRLARLVRAYYPMVWRAALRVSGHRDDAADICQDVFLKLLLDPPAPDRVVSPAGYLVWCVVGRAARIRRSDDRRRAREAEAAGRCRANGVPSEDIEALHAALGELPEDLRVAMDLHYLGGLPIREVAQLLDISERAVAARLEKGREILRRRLAPLGLAAFLGTDERRPESDVPPSALLEQILTIVRMGGALGLTSAVAMGGIVMTASKVAIVLAAVALSGAAFWVASSYIWQEPAARLDDAAQAPPIASELDGPFAAPIEAPKSADGPGEAQTAPPPAQAYAVLCGTVLDEDARPVPGANVTLQRGIGESDAGERPLETESDEWGRYEFSKLLPGRVYVTGRKEPVLAAPGFSRVLLEPGAEAFQDLYLVHLGRLTGRITSMEGQPVPGAEFLIESFRVASYEAKDPSDRFAFQADAAGQYDTGFRLIRAHRGDIPVAAQAPGFATRFEQFPAVGFRDLQGTVDFQLEPEMPVTLRVADRAGTAVEGAQVWFGGSDGRRSAGGFAWRIGETDSKGLVRIQHLSHRRYSIRIEKEGYRLACIAVEPGLPLDADVTLQPLGPPVLVRILVPPGFRTSERDELSLWLLKEDERGRFVPSPEGSLDESSRIGLRAKDGICRFHPPQPGRYKIALCDARPGEGETDAFDYSGAEEIRVDLILRGVLVRGIVVHAETDDPVPKFPVLLTVFRKANGPSHDSFYILAGEAFPDPPADSGDGQDTDEEGRFAFLLDMNRYHHIILRAGDAWRGKGWSEDVTIPWPADDTLPEVRLVLLKGGTIEGQVIGDDGMPAEGQLIAAYDGRGVLQWTYSGLEGYYRIERLRPGRYCLKGLGRRPANPGHGGGTGRGSAGMPPPEEYFQRVVEVRDGEVTRWSIDLRGDALGSIEGGLAEGLPGAGHVRYARIVHGRPRLVGGLSGTRPVVAGRFQVDRLPAASYRVSFFPSLTEKLAEADVEVKSGEATQVTLSPPSATLVVPIEGAPADPIGEIRAARVEQRTDPEETGPFAWETWAGRRATLDASRLRIEGLPAATVKVAVLARGYRAIWTEPVELREGTETSGPAIRLVRGSAVRVRIERSDGGPIPEKVEFGVNPLLPGDRAVFDEDRVPGEPTWVLSGLSPGDHRIRASAWSDLDGEVTVTIPETGDIETRIRLAPR